MYFHSSTKSEINFIMLKIYSIHNLFSLLNYFNLINALMIIVCSFFPYRCTLKEPLNTSFTEPILLKYHYSLNN